jgi:hypothetical protein
MIIMLRYFWRAGFCLLSTLLATAIVTPGPAAAAESVRQNRTSTVVPQAAVLYEIAIKTGDYDNAGTDGTVSLSLCGWDACTPFRSLEDPDKDDRERGNTDYYFREWEDVGRIRYIRLHQSGGSKWYLEWVKVTYGSRTDVFPYDNWFPQDTQDTVVKIFA